MGFFKKLKKGSFDVRELKLKLKKSCKQMTSNITFNDGRELSYIGFGWCADIWAPQQNSGLSVCHSS